MLLAETDSGFWMGFFSFLGTITVFILQLLLTRKQGKVAKEQSKIAVKQEAVSIGQATLAAKVEASSVALDKQLTQSGIAKE